MDDCIIQYLAQDLNERFQCILLAHKPLRWHFTITSSRILVEVLARKKRQKTLFNKVKWFLLKNVDDFFFTVVLPDWNLHVQYNAVKV